MQAIAVYSCHMEGEFATWLQAQLAQRGWRPADLARGAGLAESTVSRILSGTRGAGRDAAVAIAQALKVSEVVVLYRAGFLARNPEDPTQALNPVALDILAMLSDRSEVDQLAARAALKALFDGIDRGKSGRTG